MAFLFTVHLVVAKLNIRKSLKILNGRPKYLFIDLSIYIDLCLSLRPAYGVAVISAACTSIQWQQDSARWSANEFETGVTMKEDCVPQ